MEIDVHVGRNDKINIGNYSSVSPSVNLTIKNVDINKFEDVYNKLSMLMSVMYAAETKECIDTMSDINGLSKSVKVYKEMLDGQDFDNMIKDAIKDLKVDDLPF